MTPARHRAYTSVALAPRCLFRRYTYRRQLPQREKPSLRLWTANNESELCSNLSVLIRNLREFAPTSDLLE